MRRRRPEEGSAPISLFVADVHVRVVGEQEFQSPTQGLVGHYERREYPSQEVMIASAVELAPDDALILFFDVDSRSTDKFELTLPPGEAPVLLEFKQERTRFLFTAP